jgi:hypothetical protein
MSRFDNDGMQLSKWPLLKITAETTQLFSDASLCSSGEEKVIEVESGNVTEGAQRMR